MSTLELVLIQLAFLAIAFAIGTLVGFLLARLFPRVWLFRANLTDLRERTASKTTLQALAACFYWLGAVGVFLSGISGIAAVFIVVATVAGLAFYVIFFQRFGIGVGAGLIYLPVLRPWVGLPYWLWLLLGPPTHRRARLADWLAFLGALSGFIGAVLVIYTR